MKQLQRKEFDMLHFVLGVVNDKDLDDVLPLFLKNAKYYFCRPNIPRRLEASILAKKAISFGLKEKHLILLQKLMQKLIKMLLRMTLFTLAEVRL